RLHPTPGRTFGAGDFVGFALGDNAISHECLDVVQGTSLHDKKPPAKPPVGRRLIPWGIFLEVLQTQQKQCISGPYPLGLSRRGDLACHGGLVFGGPEPPTCLGGRCVRGIPPPRPCGPFWCSPRGEA